MALWRNRRRIEAAVLGELSGGDELKLFAHLRGCDGCRAHYEPLARAAEALSPALTARREEARLTAGLQPPAPVVARPSPVRWVAVFATLAAVLAVFFWPARRGDDDVAWRGGGPDEKVPVAALLIYAREGAGGAVHLAADFPLAGVVKLGREQQVQFFLRHPLEGGRCVVRATSAHGVAVLLAEGEVGAGSEHSVAVGSAFSLSRLEVGAWRVTASLRGADAGLIEVNGMLEVTP